MSEKKNRPFIYFSDSDPFDDEYYLDDDDDDEKGEKGRYVFNEWIFDGLHYSSAKDTKVVKVLPAGFYNIVYSNNETLLTKTNVTIDNLYLFPNTLIKDAIVEIDDFWNKKNLFKEHGILHRRGLLFVGPPGTGKTSLLTIISYELVKKGGLVFFIKTGNDLHSFITFMKNKIRVIEPDRNVIAIIEDIDQLYNNSKSLLLNFLNGEDQQKHLVTIATCNKPHELDDLILRPSRFDRIVLIENPNEKERRFFFNKKQIPEEEIEEWVKKTSDLSIAHLKELYIGVKLLGNDLDKTIERLNGQLDYVEKTSFIKKQKKAGF